MVELKTAQEMGLQRQAGRVVAEALLAVRERAEVGVTLAELDRVAAKVIEAAGATPAFLGLSPILGAYALSGCDLCQRQRCGRPRHPWPNPPGQRRPGEHRLWGFWAAGAATPLSVSSWVGPAGRPRTDRRHRRGFAARIEAAQPGRSLGDVGHAIGLPARKAGYGLLATTAATA